MRIIYQISYNLNFNCYGLNACKCQMYMGGVYISLIRIINESIVLKAIIHAVLCGV